MPSAADKGKSFGVFLTDLTNAFDCLSCKLLISKLNSYGFCLNAPQLIYRYLSNRKQRTKISEKYSLWEVHQGSNLGPLLFNIFVCDLFVIPRKCIIKNF